MDKSSLIRSLGKSVVKYFRDDLCAAYALLEPASATFSGDGIGIGSCKVGPLSVESVRGGSIVRLDCEPFEAKERHWNGPNLIPDNLDDGSMEASLWHDLIWKFAPQIAEQTGLTENEVMTWGNGILRAAWEGYAERAHPGKQTQAKFLSRVGYSVCDVSKWFWRKFRSLIPALLVAAFMYGCAAPPDWEMTDASEIVHGPNEGK